MTEQVEHYPYAILYLDDEKKALKYFDSLFEDFVTIYTASTADEAFQIFEEHQHEIGLVLSDQMMPDITGIEFLSKIREINPAPVRNLVTAFADLDQAVQAFNKGIIHCYISKPWDPEEMETRLRSTLDQFIIKHQRDELLEERAKAYEQLSMADRAAAMDLLSVGLNHHLRNSLNAFQLFVDMMPEKLAIELDNRPAKDEDFWKEFYEDICEQLDYMTNMLSSLSDASGTSQFNFVDGVDLYVVFEQAHDMVFTGVNNLSVNISYKGEERPILKGDEAHLIQMARRLFQEGVLTLSGQDDGEIDVIIDRDLSKQVYRVTIADNGPLIDQNDLNRIFDPFFIRTDDPEDFGMNLVGSYLTVYHHGGTMVAQHLPDGRNGIVFTLPYVACPPDDSTRVSRGVLGSCTVAAEG